MEDRASLPYTEATIMECQRISCVAPGGLEHKVMEDTEVLGHKINKGTFFYYNIE